jgi:hypothetical protein
MDPDDNELIDSDDNELIDSDDEEQEPKSMLDSAMEYVNSINPFAASDNFGIGGGGIAALVLIPVYLLIAFVIFRVVMIIIHNRNEVARGRAPLKILSNIFNSSAPIF